MLLELVEIDRVIANELVVEPIVRDEHFEHAVEERDVAALRHGNQ